MKNNRFNPEILENVNFGKPKCNRSNSTTKISSFGSKIIQNGFHSELVNRLIIIMKHNIQNGIFNVTDPNDSDRKYVSLT